MKRKTKKKLLVFDCIAIIFILGVFLFYSLGMDENFGNKKVEKYSILSNKEIVIPWNETVKSAFTLTNKAESELNGQTAQMEKDKQEIHISVVGDVLLSTSPLNKYDQTSTIQSILSDDLVEQMQKDDLTFANVEFPFSLRGHKMPDKQYTFRTDPKRVHILNEMGLDLATLANNHILDYGTEALLDTITTLNHAGIKNMGAGKDLTEAKKPLTLTIKGRTFAFLGASRVIPVYEWNATSEKAGVFTTYDPSLLIEEIKQAKQKNDFVVVYVHWGKEHKEYPEEYQRVLGKQYIDAGADVVIGSHTHRLQGIEFYMGKPIIYSLGNFIFGHTIEQTLLLDLIVDHNNAVQLRIIPCAAKDAYTHAIVEETKKKKFFEYYESISYNISIDKDGYVSN